MTEVVVFAAEIVTRTVAVFAPAGMLTVAGTLATLELLLLNAIVVSTDDVLARVTMPASEPES